MNVSRRAVLGSAAVLPLASRAALAARTPGTLTFGLSTYPPNLLPWANTGTAQVTVKYCAMRGLTSYDNKGLLRPELAESWTRDGETGWLFKLREAQFHDGKPVTAEDVKWTLEQVAAPKSTAFMKNQFQSVKAIETPDARTVRIVLDAPNVMLPEWLANPHMPIVAKGSTDNGGTAMTAGPYKIAAAEKGVSIDLVASGKYWRAGLPKLKNIRFVAYADENLRVAAVQAGDVDLIEYVPWQSMSSIEKDPKLKLLSVPGPFMALSFNGNGPFHDKRVRQAVAYAIKREEIVNAAFFGRGSPLRGLPIAPGTPFYDPAAADHWTYDPDKAKGLLKAAGVPNGFKATLLSTAQYGMHKSTAEVVQQNLAGIGIEVTLNLPDWATRVALGNRGQYEFCVQGTTTDNNDFDGAATVLDGQLPPNNARSVNIPTPETHALFEKGRAEFDFAKRKAIYAELTRQALDECFLVGLAWRAQGYAMAKDVDGFVNLPGAMTFFSGLTLEDTYFG
jgi:peptide/nickel transport system substrate-binding protein